MIKKLLESWSQLCFFIVAYLRTYQKAWQTPGIQKQRVNTILKHIWTPHALSPPPPIPCNAIARGGKNTARMSRQILAAPLVSRSLLFSPDIISSVVVFCCCRLVEGVVRRLNESSGEVDPVVGVEM